METKYYIVARIDGDYAWLKQFEQLIRQRIMETE